MRLATFGAVGLSFMALSCNAYAVSIADLAYNCGADGEVHCQGVSYGEDMQACLNTHYDELEAACKSVMDRLNSGERVTLF